MSETSITVEERGKLTARAAVASSAMAVMLIALKAYAALHTSSMAMLGMLNSGMSLSSSV